MEAPIAMPTPRTIKKGTIHWYSAFSHQGSSWEALEAGWSSGEEEISSRGVGEEGFLGEWEQAQEAISNITEVIKATDLLLIRKII